MKRHLLAVALTLWSSSASADGIQAFLMGPPDSVCTDDILTQEQYESTIFGPKEGLYTAYLGLRLQACGDAPVNPYAIAWYIPGDPRFYWDQPDLLPPPPSPVPLPATGWLMLAVIGAMCAVKRKWI